MEIFNAPAAGDRVERHWIHMIGNWHKDKPSLYNATTQLVIGDFDTKEERDAYIAERGLIVTY